MNLRHLSDSEFEEAEKLAKASGTPLSRCPTCDDTGKYRFRGKEHECDCTTQVALRKHYLLAGIGEQYQRLHWSDYEGPKEAKDTVEVYLDKWPSFKKNGMGVEFSGKELGVGKTFAATHLGKELIKRGERVFFIPYMELLNAHQRKNSDDFMQNLKDVTILILDEVIAPITEAQRGFFTIRIEELIRHRTNNNLPVIMTTNLLEEDLFHHYPRSYSLLEAKQVRIKMEGKDARMGKIGMENIELAMANEVRPIT